jgi:uncharacterized membrane protein YhaH (DUF805 family)
MSRRNYFFSTLLNVVVLTLLKTLPSSVPADKLLTTSLLVFELLVAIVCVLFQWSFLVRRIHDFDKSGWFSVLFLVPVVNIFVGLYLLLKRGDENQNMYGVPDVNRSFWKSVFDT